MNVVVTGAEIGRQWIGGNVNNYEWRVSYLAATGIRNLDVPSHEAWSAADAIQVAKRKLGG